MNENEGVSAQGTATEEPRGITEEDRNYASELLADLANGEEPRLLVAAQWFCKARVEHSLAAPPALHAALREAEAAFEFIRLKLINHLEEPERSAFWKAVAARDAIRAALQPEVPDPVHSGQRNAVIEECAAVLDEAAHDWNRIRDPGMANNARSYARKIRALSSSNSPGATVAKPEGT